MPGAAAWGAYNAHRREAAEKLAKQGPDALTADEIRYALSIHPVRRSVYDITDQQWQQLEALASQNAS